MVPAVDLTPFVYYPGTQRVYPDRYDPPPGPGPTQNPQVFRAVYPGTRPTRVLGYPFNPGIRSNRVLGSGTRLTGVPVQTGYSGTRRLPWYPFTPGTRLASCVRGQHA